MTKSLYTVDGSVGTADLAFLAHLNPTLAWSNAWWEGWADCESLTYAFTGANEKLDNAKASKWAVVKGPVAAVITTALRLGWRLDSPSTAIDDVGARWNFQVDPPAAIKKAVKQSVRRWRFEQVAANTPGLTPACSDIKGIRIKDTVLVECSAAAITSLGRNSAKQRDAPNCSGSSSLTSHQRCAAANGRRPERLASRHGGSATQTASCAMPRAAPSRTDSTARAPGQMEDGQESQRTPKEASRS